jgi:hypothetical protein
MGQESEANLSDDMAPPSTPIPHTLSVPELADVLPRPEPLVGRRFPSIIG